MTATELFWKLITIVDVLVRGRFQAVTVNIMEDNSARAFWITFLLQISGMPHGTVSLNIQQLRVYGPEDVSYFVTAVLSLGKPHSNPYRSPPGEFLSPIDGRVYFSFYPGTSVCSAMSVHLSLILSLSKG